MTNRNIRNQKRITLAFLKRIAQRAEKETGIKGWECLVDDEDPINDKDKGVYIMGNNSFDPSLIVEVNLTEKSFVVCIYNQNETFFKSIFENIKKELPKAAKELKINDWEIKY